MKNTNNNDDFKTRVFSRWISNQLNEKLDNKEDLLTDISNGTTILQLAIQLTHSNIKMEIKNQPKSRMEKIKNCEIALRLFQNDGLKLSTISSSEIVNNNKRVILDLIWSIILHYSVQNKKKVFEWALEKTDGYQNIKNFSPYWLSICALLDCYAPKKVHFSSLNSANAKTNAKLATKVMEELGVPVYINYEELRHKKIDKKSLLVQLSALKNILDDRRDQVFGHNRKISLEESEVLSFIKSDYVDPVINYGKKYEDKIFELSLELAKAKLDISSQKVEIEALNREAELFANTLSDKLKELSEISKTLKTEENHSKKYIAEIDDIDEDEELLAKQLIDTQEENEALNREADLFAYTLSEKLNEYSAVDREADIFANALSESLEKNKALNTEADLFANKLSETLDENKSLKLQVRALNNEADLFANFLNEKISENKKLNRKIVVMNESLAKETQANVVLNREADLFAYNLADRIDEIKKLNTKINNDKKKKKINR